MTQTINPKILITQQHYLKLTALVKVARYSIHTMEKNHVRLHQISKTHSYHTIREQAAEHLKKQQKLISIAYELLARMLDKMNPKSNNNLSIDSSFIAQITEEVDLLNYMNFQVTKTYFSFIKDHYETPMVQLFAQAA